MSARLCCFQQPVQTSYPHDVFNIHQMPGPARLSKHRAHEGSFVTQQRAASADSRALLCFSLVESRVFSKHTSPSRDSIIRAGFMFMAGVVVGFCELPLWYVSFDVFI